MKQYILQINVGFTHMFATGLCSYGMVDSDKSFSGFTITNDFKEAKRFNNIFGIIYFIHRHGEVSGCELPRICIRAVKVTNKRETVIELESDLPSIAS